MHVFLKALLRKSHHTEKDLFSLHPWHHKHPHPAKVHGGTLEPGSWNWIQPTFAAASRNRAKIKKTATKFPLTWKWFFFAPLIICRKGKMCLFLLLEYKAAELCIQNHTSYLSFLLHRQDFLIPNLYTQKLCQTPKNYNKYPQKV